MPRAIFGRPPLLISGSAILPQRRSLASAGLRELSGHRKAPLKCRKALPILVVVSVDEFGARKWIPSSSSSLASVIVPQRVGGAAATEIAYR